MKGFVVCSHGDLALGMENTLHMFFGDNIEQIAFLSLATDEEVDDYYDRLEKKCIEVDTGDGVIIFTDMFGGTPNNCAMKLLDKYDVISGYNMPMLMTFLTKRHDVVNIKEILEECRESLIYVNSLNRNIEEDEF